LVNKPTNLSSFAVVRKIRQLTGVKKVGHAGTLDPQASGLLIILIGKEFTKKASQFLKLDKTYLVEMTLGSVSDTGDSEGKIAFISSQKPTPKAVIQALSQFTGKIIQTPPVYSAVKIKGVRAYRLARTGKMLNLPRRQVTVYQIDLLSYRYPKIKFLAKVSSGTYIRSLVEDIGKWLGVGAYTSKLHRTRIGKYNIKDALSFDHLN